LFDRRLHPRQDDLEPHRSSPPSPSPPTHPPVYLLSPPHEQTPQLRALAPMITWADAEQSATRGGALELGLQGNWLLLQGLGQMVRRYQGDPQALGAAMYGVARTIDSLAATGYNSLPLEGFAPLARFDLDAPINAAIAARDRRDFSLARRGPPDYSRIQLPAFHVGGWYDVFLEGTLQNFQRMRAAGAPGQFLVIGPWTHGKFDALMGDVYFGMAAAGAFLDLRGDLVTMQTQFFDHWLKGLPNGFEQQPAVKYFLMGANVWKTSSTWPPANIAEMRWYLHSGGGANTASGDGMLSQEAPADNETPDRYDYDPVNPAPTVGGATLLHPEFRAGPRDQRIVEARPDVLVYTSEPLSAPLEVTGPISVTLAVATDALDTDFIARLVDVYPDGAAMPLADGILRMRYRNGIWNDAEPLDVGRPCYAITIDLLATANVFLPGHCIRLDVTSSSFPRWERNLNTGASSAASAELRVARQTILHDGEHPSYVTLPVVDA
ncbi:MAG: CocE/NonD family hydrolase, partial [Ktedonobacterales bacterium]